MGLLRCTVFQISIVWIFHEYSPRVAIDERALQLVRTAARIAIARYKVCIDRYHCARRTSCLPRVEPPAKEQKARTCTLCRRCSRALSARARGRAGPGLVPIAISMRFILLSQVYEYMHTGARELVNMITLLGSGTAFEGDQKPHVSACPTFKLFINCNNVHLFPSHNHVLQSTLLSFQHVCQALHGSFARFPQALAREGQIRPARQTGGQSSPSKAGRIVTSVWRTTWLRLASSKGRSQQQAGSCTKGSMCMRDLNDNMLPIRRQAIAQSSHVHLLTRGY